MPDTTEHLVNRLLIDRQKSLDYFNNLYPVDWERAIYTEGSCWTVHQVLAHFVAAEEGFHRLIIDILNGGSGSPEDFDLDQYNERKVNDLTGIPISNLMQKFSDLRQDTVNLVAEMDSNDLEKQGRHPFLGMAPLSDIVKLIYRHNQIHIREIRKTLTEET